MTLLGLVATFQNPGNLFPLLDPLCSAEVLETVGQTQSKMEHRKGTDNTRASPCQCSCVGVCFIMSGKVVHCVQ